MKKKFTSQSAFCNLRVLIGTCVVLAGVFLALVGFGVFSAQAQQKQTSTQSVNLITLLPPGFDCSQISALGIDRQDNMRAGAIMIACGQAQGGAASPGTAFSQFVQRLLAPAAYGTTDVNLISQTEAGTHITQSETFAAANPDNPNEIVVAYNDSRDWGTGGQFIDISGASVSTNGGTTFTRLTTGTGRSPFPNTFGDPVIMYNSNLGTWFTVWLDGACGSQGLGGFKSTTPADPNSWTHFCIHNGSSDDRESGWVDNTSSTFAGRMYVSWNDFARSAGIFVRFSDNGTTWTERQITNTFFRNVQITGDLGGTGHVYLAAMDEMGGGLTNRANRFYRSTDGGNSWSLVNTGPTFAAPGRNLCPNTYFACMYPDNGGTWRHMGWGQPAALNGTVHYVYASRRTGDPGDVFYVRSTDNGVTFSAPFKLNTDATNRLQWQPNLSAATDGSLFAVWYDERETANCQNANPAVPCYRMWARKSTDNGATWLADMEFSDVVTPLPGQQDPGIIAEYRGDYDYSYQLGTAHLHPWVDGRVAVSGQSQQNTFFDQEGGGGGFPITLEARVLTQGNEHRVKLRWDPADGGNINILRDSVVIGTTADDGQAVDKTLGTQTGTFTYQVCETDSGDCSNEVIVQVP
jgi:hypothetical protein